MQLLIVLVLSLLIMQACFAFVSRSSTAATTRSTLTMNFFKSLKQNIVKQIAGDYDEAAITSLLNGYIASSRKGVTMLSFEKCPFCVEARNVMDKKGIKYEDIMIDKIDEGVHYIHFYHIPYILYPIPYATLLPYTLHPIPYCFSQVSSCAWNSAKSTIKLQYRLSL